MTIRDMWQTMAALHEYRVFLPVLPPELAEHFGPIDDLGATSEETYVVPREPDGYNVKIRAGGIEIKALVDQSHGLQKWQPLTRLDFPIARQRLIDEVLKRLDVAAPALLGETYSESAFLYQVAVPSDTLDITKVIKQRRKSVIDGCNVEIARLAIADVWHCDTLALESRTPEAVLAMAEKLQLFDHPNQSYPAFIRRLTGRAAPAA